MRRLDEHRGILFKVAAAYCRGRDDRDDLVQCIAMQAWRAYPRFDESRVFATWLYRIAVNVAISFYRQNRRDTQRFVAIDDLALERLPQTPDRETDDHAAILQTLIEQLNEFDRALIILFLEGEQHAAIADILGISETNVATKISRIKQRLRRQALDARTV